LHRIDSAAKLCKTQVGDFSAGFESSVGVDPIVHLGLVLLPGSDPGGVAAIRA
jgi:hypothetical protein